jgi:hypothetical protein
MTDALASDIGRCGGTGGNVSITKSCPAGQYVVGLYARGFQFVDQVGIRCAPFNAQGQVGTPGAWQIAGPGGGTGSNSAHCTGNGAIARIPTASGLYLDYIYQIECHARKTSGGFESVRYEWKSVGIGGPGGIPCSLTCPSGEALYGIKIKYGSWIDSLRGFCRP